MPVAMRKRSWEEHVTHRSGLPYSFDDLDLVCCRSAGPGPGDGSKHGRQVRCASMPECHHHRPAPDGIPRGSDSQTDGRGEPSEPPGATLTYSAEPESDAVPPNTERQEEIFPASHAGMNCSLSSGEACRLSDPAEDSDGWLQANRVTEQTVTDAAEEECSAAGTERRNVDAVDKVKGLDLPATLVAESQAAPSPPAASEGPAVEEVDPSSDSLAFHHSVLALRDVGIAEMDQNREEDRVRAVIRPPQHTMRDGSPRRPGSCVGFLVQGFRVFSFLLSPSLKDEGATKAVLGSQAECRVDFCAPRCSLEALCQVGTIDDVEERRLCFKDCVDACVFVLGLQRDSSRLDSMVLLLMKLDQLDKEIDNALSATSSMDSTPTPRRRNLDMDPGSQTGNPSQETLLSAAPSKPHLGAKPKTSVSTVLPSRPALHQTPHISLQ
uniref:Uncharacterized protein n=1 Tax=Gadus morhua TaxID=8049 RepID=A0A8C5B994_GADMO